jgi:hypothetical protein
VASGSMYESTMIAVVIGALAWIGAGFALLRTSRSLRRERLLGMGG